MALQPRMNTIRPATGVSTSSTNTVQKGEHVRQEKHSSSRIRAKLLSSIVVFAVIISGSVVAKDIEFERGSDAAAAHSAAQAAHVGLNNAGISCSVDSAYGPDFLWTRWYSNAILSIDSSGATSLVLFNDDGVRDTSCSDAASVRVVGAVEITFSQTATGGQYLVHTTGRSMGLVQLSAREMIARIIGATEVASTR